MHTTGYQACREHRTWLREQHGPAVMLADTAAALRLAGARHLVHPRQAVAFTYRDEAAARAYAAANLEHHQVPSLGIVVTEGGGVVGVLDLRVPMGCEPVDPALPDDWEYGQPEPLAG